MTIPALAADPQASPGRDRPWDMWRPTVRDPGADHAELAYFVVESLYVGHRFNVNARPDDSPAGRAAVAEGLYTRFAEANLPYRWQAWSPAAGQWVKDPVWFAEQSGTCLDFAVTYAAVLLAHDIAPVLALTRNHAYVCVDLGRRPHRSGSERTGPMFGGALGAGRVVRVTDDLARADSLLMEANSLCLPVDVTQAASTARTDTLRGAQPFSTAVDRARALVDGGGLWLVDVTGLQADSPDLVRVPFDAQQRPRPAITTLVPDVDTDDYQAQADVEAALADEDHSGLVLHGPPGRGKSLAALVGLKTQSSRAGWFLNATDRQTLVTSLASAELAESQVPDSMVATGEEARWFAGLAVERLGREQPWMVVLDNAEAGPADIADLVPVPGPAFRQRLVVTTTNDAWLAWAAGRDGWATVEVEPFGDDALDRLHVPADGGLRVMTAGRALFATSFARAARSGVDVTVAVDEEHGVDPAAGLLWQAVNAHLGKLADPALAARARAAALAAAWMQPDRIPETVLALAAGLAGDGRDAVSLLVSAGILSRYETGTVRVHRLVAQAVRGRFPADAALRVVGTSAYAEDAKYRADTATLRLVEALLDAPTKDLAAWVAATRTLITVLEHRGKAAEADGPAGKLIDRLSCVDDDALDGATASALAEALHSRARAVNQREGADRTEVEHAIRDFVDRSQRMRERLGDNLGVSKSTTMRGLLQTKVARTVPDLLEARRILIQARDERRAHWGAGHEDTARAEFNIATPNINLAQKDPTNALAYLDEARRAYREAWDIRRQRFPNASHPFRAASDHGFALADYYEALIAETDPVARQTLLRRAEGHIHNAVRTREALDGRFDASDTVKSLTLAAKIAEARVAYAAGAAADLAAHRRAELAAPRAGAEPAGAAPGRWPDAWPGPVEVGGRANASREVMTKQRAAYDEFERWWAAGMALELRADQGVRWVVTTRHGGFSRSTSRHDFATMNLGDHVGDDHDRVMRNRRLVADVLGVPALTFADQQHRNRVAVIDEHLRFAGHAGNAEATELLGATDGMVTHLRRTPLAIMVADCVPIALYDPVKQAIGVAHAGRGGTVLGIVPAVITTMGEVFGTEPTDLRVAVGPCIGPADYEVGPDEVCSFLEVVDGDTSLISWTDRESGKASLHIEATLRLQLTRAGVPDDAVGSTGINTRRSTDTFFSDRQARHDRGLAGCGRFALICWLP